MRVILTLALGIALITQVWAGPTDAERAVIKKYDGQTFTADGLVKLQTQDGGWTQYQWTEGRFLWKNSRPGVFAVVELDGTEIYRYSASKFVYRFADGRTVYSDPVAGTLTWPPGEGDPAPDFELKSLDGTTTIKLSALRGQVVFLDFWASWCGPCQRALPGTEALYQKFKARGLKVLGINIEGDSKKALANAVQLKLTFPSLASAPGADGQYNWSSAQIRDYMVEGIPQGVLIDKKGIIRARDTVVEADGLVAKLLAE